MSLPVKKCRFYEISMHLLQKPIEYIALFCGSLPENDKSIDKLWDTRILPSDYCQVYANQPRMESLSKSVLMNLKKKKKKCNLVACSVSTLCSGKAGISLCVAYTRLGAFGGILCVCMRVCLCDGEITRGRSDLRLILLQTTVSTQSFYINMIW